MTIPRRVMEELFVAAGVELRTVYAVEIGPFKATFRCYSQHDGRPYLRPNRKECVTHWVTVPIDWSTQSA